MAEYYLIAFLAVFLTALGHVCFKLGATREPHRSTLTVYLNWYSVLAYAMMLGVTLLNLYAYKVLPLKVSVIIHPFTYIFIAAFSFLILSERISRSQVMGAGFVIIGLVVFNLETVLRV